jgi:RNA polymerase sigma-70 factor (ECF subfamily)
LDERDLVARALAGELSAERAIYDAHVDRVFRLAYRLAGDPDIAEELTQETFVRAFDRLHGFRGEAALSSWVHAIAVSVILNGLRGLKRRRRHEVCWENAESPADPRLSGDVDLRRRLIQAVDSLPNSLRVVFVMHDMEGYRHREIAAALGIPEGTSKARLSRAKQILRKAIADETVPGLRKLEPRVET